MVPNLRYDGESLSELMQTDGADVDAVDDDRATASLDQPEQGQGHRALSCSRPTHDANLSSQQEVG